MIWVLGFDCRPGLGIFLLPTAFREALEPTRPPIPRVTEVISLGVKRPGREADHSPPSSAEIKNAWSYTSTPQYVFMAWYLVKQRDFNFYPYQSLTWGPFEKFVDSPYYSESQLCRSAVTVSFSKYLPWQAMHFLQRSTHFSKTYCRPLITSKFLALELPFHGWKSPEIAWGEVWTVRRMF
jgi:hypothetical protein